MRSYRRPPTVAERQAATPPRSFVSRLLGRRNPATAALDEVEVLEFEVIRAWNLITCPGGECCPNTWVLETRDGRVVWFTSWEFLSADAEQFPGTQVTVVRNPETGQLVAASATGASVATLQAPERLQEFEGTQPVEVFERDHLPGIVAEVLGA